MPDSRSSLDHDAGILHHLGPFLCFVLNKAAKFFGGTATVFGAVKFEQYGAEDGGGSAEKFGSFIQDEAKKWAKVVKDAGVKVEA